MPSGITSDLLFNQRIHNATVDLGVYEYGAASTLSVDDFVLTMNDVKVYPNPTSDHIKIKSPIKINSVEVFRLPKIPFTKVLKEIEILSVVAFGFTFT